MNNYVPNPALRGARQLVVTDRALRYRANAAELPGPRICHYCGSQAGRLDIDHVDGREEHGNPANLSYACRSCNTRKGRYFALQGVGRKTRQYNPSGASGARTAAQWAQVTGSVTGPGPLPPARAIATILATPHERRARFAAELARHTNPEENGPFGPVFREFYHDAPGAIAKLRQVRDGEAVAALYHPAIGNIDLVWGKERDEPGRRAFGLAKIEQKHPGMLDILPGEFPLLRRNEDKDAGNNLVLENERYKAVVTTEWRGRRKVWLLTMYEPLRAQNGRSASKVLAGVFKAKARGTAPSRGDRSTTSIGRKSTRGNPPEPTYAQYVAAVREHAKGAHDEAGKVIHATSKARRSEYARRIADWKKKHRGEVPF